MHAAFGPVSARRLFHDYETASAEATDELELTESSHHSRVCQRDPLVPPIAQVLTRPTHRGMLSSSACSLRRTRRRCGRSASIAYRTRLIDSQTWRLRNQGGMNTKQASAQRNVL
jgi:hypothetical protein